MQNFYLSVLFILCIAFFAYMYKKRKKIKGFVLSFELLLFMPVIIFIVPFSIAQISRNNQHKEHIRSLYVQLIQTKIQTVKLYTNEFIGARLEEIIKDINSTWAIKKETKQEIIISTKDIGDLIIEIPSVGAIDPDGQEEF